MKARTIKERIQFFQANRSDSDSDSNSRERPKNNQGFPRNHTFTDTQDKQSYDSNVGTGLQNYQGESEPRRDSEKGSEQAQHHGIFGNIFVRKKRKENNEAGDGIDSTNANAIMQDTGVDASTPQVYPHVVPSEKDSVPETAPKRRVLYESFDKNAGSQLQQVEASDVIEDLSSPDVTSSQQKTPLSGFTQPQQANPILKKYDQILKPGDIRWTQNELVLRHLNGTISSLIQNGATIVNYQDQKRKDDDEQQSSLGTISSADEADMRLLFSGDHTYQFQAIQRIKKQVLKAEEEMTETKKALDKEKKCESFLRDLILCKGYRARLDRIKEMNHDYQRKLKVFQKFFKKKSNQKQIKAKLITGIRRDSVVFNPDKTNGNQNTAKEDNAIKRQAPQINIAQPSLLGAKKSNIWAQVRQRALESKPGDSMGHNRSEQRHNEDGDDKGCDAKCSHDGQDEEEEEEENSDLVDSGAMSVASQEDQLDLGIDDEEEKPPQLPLWRQRLLKYAIDPTWQRVQQFRLLAAFTFYVDYFLTTFMIGNGMVQSAETGFMHYKPMYVIIMIIQVAEMILNFLTIKIVDAKIVEDPLLLSINYMKFGFWHDLISVIPWPFFAPQVTFLRLLRVSLMSEYQQCVDDNICFYMNGLINSINLKKVMNAVDLLTKLSFIAHLFANLWILIGKVQEEKGAGWLLAYKENGLLSETEFMSLYSTSIYWVVVTFSSVGYGDITGSTPTEMAYQMMVMMIGIGFFGYMIGVFQNLLSGLSQSDQTSEQQDTIQLWLVVLDRAKPNCYLSPKIFSVTKDYYLQRIKFDTSCCFESDFFRQLKPRLQRALMKLVFEHIDEPFKFLFEDCQYEFKAKIYRKAQYRMFAQDCQQRETEDLTDQTIEWFERLDIPVIEEAGKYSKNFNLIIKGKCYVMDKRGIFEYGMLSEGGCFGDISILTKRVNEFSYFYDNHSEVPLQLLSVNTTDFQEILDEFPLARRILELQAKRRIDNFRMFKRDELLKQMKGILANPMLLTNIGQQNSVSQKSTGLKNSQRGPKQTPLSRTPDMPPENRHFTLELDIFELAIKQYELKVTLWDFEKKIDHSCSKRVRDQKKSEHHNDPDAPRDKTGRYQMSQHEIKDAKFKAMLIDRKVTLRTEIKHCRNLIEQKYGPGFVSNEVTTFNSLKRKGAFEVAGTAPISKQITLTALDQQPTLKSKLTSAFNQLEGGSETPGRRSYLYGSSARIRSHSAPNSKEGGSSERSEKPKLTLDQASGNSVMGKPPTGAGPMAIRRHNRTNSNGSSRKKSSTSGDDSGKNKRSLSRDSKRNSQNKDGMNSVEFLKDSQGTAVIKPPPVDLGQMSESSIKGIDSLNQVNSTGFKGVWDSNNEGSQQYEEVKVRHVDSNLPAPQRNVHQDVNLASVATFAQRDDAPLLDNERPRALDTLPFPGRPPVYGGIQDENKNNDGNSDISSQNLSNDRDVAAAICVDPVAAARQIIAAEREEAIRAVTKKKSGLELDVAKANEKGGLLTSERKRLHEFERLDQELQHGQDEIVRHRVEILQTIDENLQLLCEKLEKYFQQQLKTRQKYRKHYRIGSYGHQKDQQVAQKAQESMDAAWIKNLSRVDSIIMEYVQCQEIMDLETKKGERIFDKVKDKGTLEKKQAENVVGRQQRIKVMQAQQEKLFTEIKSHVLRNLIETVQEFAKRFETKCQIIESRVQKQIDNKLNQVVRDFDSLEDSEKDYFVRKAVEVDIHNQMQSSLLKYFKK